MEWARIEPKVVDMKFYAPGIGIVLEKALAGGQEVAARSGQIPAFTRSTNPPISAAASRSRRHR